MKLFERIFSVTTVLSVLLSCTGEDLGPDKGPGTSDPVLTNADFRGCIDAVNRAWNPDEKVMVYDNVSEEGSQFAVSQIGSDGNCILKGMVYDTAELYYALYPASAFEGFADGTAVLAIPSVQTLPHQDSTKASAASAAVAMTHSRELDFVSVASYISFDILTDKVSSLTVRSNDETAPSGTLSLSIADGTVVSATGDKEVTLTPAGDSFKPGRYYVQVKPGAYAAGLVVDVACPEGESLLVDLTLPEEVKMGKTVYAGTIKTPFRTLEASEVAFSSARLDWASNLKASSYNIYVNGVKTETLSGEVRTHLLTGLKTGAENVVMVEAVAEDGKTTSAELKVTTSGVYQVTKSTGSSFLCIGWDAPTRPEIHGTTQAYQIQVFADEDMSVPVYDLVPQPGGNNTQTQLFGNGSYYGYTQQLQGPDNVSTSNYLTPTKVSVGGFYPATTYYVRMRTLASFTQENGTVLMHPWGDTPWSDLVPMTTDAAHVPAAGEIIYGGFNDMCVQHDFLNSCLGALNKNKGEGIAWDKRPAQLFYFYHNNQNYHQASTFGLASKSPRIDGAAVLASATNCNIHAGNPVGTGNTYIGDMTGWTWTEWTRPLMGAFALDGKETFVATPALKSELLSAEGTGCTLTFKASLRTRISDTYSADDDAVRVQAWRAQTSSYETVKTFKTSEILPFDVAKDTKEEVLNDYGRNTLECDLTLSPGDNVEIVAARNGQIILDDILVVKK